jgi:transposase
MGRHYVGPDVSLERTSVRLLDEADAIVWRGNVASMPEAIAAAISAHAPQVARIGLETT